VICHGRNERRAPHEQLKEGADNSFLQTKRKCPGFETRAKFTEGQASGAGGQGQTLHQCLCFCITKCQINASPLCAVPIHSRFFWSAVPAWARFREMTQAERSGGVNELPHPLTWGIPCDDDLRSALDWAVWGPVSQEEKAPLGVG
jgi:hypothetical protein